MAARRPDQTTSVPRSVAIAAFVENAPTAIAMLDRDLKFIAFSPSFFEGMGLDEATVIGRTPYEIAPETERYRPMHERCLAGARELTEAERIQPPTGGDRWMMWDTGPWLDDDGAIGGVLIISRDVTAQHRAEEALEATRGFLATVIEGVPAPLVVKDGADGRFLILNRAGEELLGVDRQDHVGKTGYDIFPREQADRFAAEDREVIESGQLKVIEEETVLTPNNGERVLRTKKIAVRNADGHDYLLSISEDVTELKRGHEALRTALSRAEAANRAKDEFLATMSHEIRTPLNGVIGIADVLVGTPLNDRQREMIRIIRGSAQTLETLLAGVLDLALIEAGGVIIATEPFQLAQAVREVAGLFEPQAIGKGVGLILDIDPRAETQVMGDVVRLKQILTNLVNNAVKFTDRGEVDIGVVSLDQDRFRIEVRDTGVGFEPAQAERLFQRFQQGDGSVTRRFGGAGLGLAICRECADLMGAELSCASAPGEGSVFALTLSLSPAADPEPQVTEETKPAAPKEEELRVLIVDDNPVNRQVLEMILDQVGVKRVSVENGALAVDAFQRQPFDVVLMDIQMPVMDGLAATRAIRHEEQSRGHGHTPVIIVSANCLPEHVEAGRAAGADGHLAKPISVPALLAALTDAGDIRRSAAA